MFGSGSFSFGFIKLLDFLIYLVITVNAVFFVVKFFSLFLPCYFVSGVCFTHCIRHFKLGVLGPREFFWRAGSCIFCVCDSAVWSAGPVRFYSGTLLERRAGLYKLFCLSSSVVAGTVRLK